MEKKNLLQEISNLAQKGEISLEEITQAYKQLPPTSDQKPARLIALNVENVLSFLGAGVIIIGILILIVQNWQDLTSIARLLITLGTSLTLYYVWVLLKTKARYVLLAYSSLLVSGILFPIGIYVLLNSLSYGADPSTSQIIIFGTCAAVFTGAFLTIKNPLNLLFSILYSTYFIYSIVFKLIDTISTFDDVQNFIRIAILTIGISHLCLGQFLRNTKDGKHVSILVLLIGSLEMLGALFSFTFAKGILGQIFEMIYPGIILGSMMLSVYQKTRSLLVISALFTIAYLVRISVVYFADSLGWPLILVIIGLVFIGLGYLVYNLNNRFIKTSSDK